MRSILLNLLLIAVAYTSTAQMQGISPLKKGDTIPDFSFKINKGDTQYNIRMSDYKGKIILLDFWGINCADCIAGMPDMLELQKKFTDKIQIIVVTENTESEIQKLWKKFENKPGAGAWINAGKLLPFIKGDSILTRLFPHSGLPTHIWIDDKQVILAKAYSSSTTPENIRQLIAGKPVNFDESGVLDLDYYNPLSWLDEKKGIRDQVQYFSFILNHIEFGLGGFSFADLLKDTISNENNGISCVNKSILDLYKVAYKDRLSFRPHIPDNRVIIEAKDKQKYFPPQDYAKYYPWASANIFCYGLKMPVSASNQLYATMRSDLDRFFYIKSSIEKRNIKCWVLKRITQMDKLAAKGNIEKYERSNGRFILHNVETNSLYYVLKDIIDLKFPNSPFLNKINYTGKIDIELPWQTDLKNISIPKLKNVLRQYGLDIIEQYNAIDMLIIKEI